MQNSERAARECIALGVVARCECDYSLDYRGVDAQVPIDTQVALDAHCRVWCGAQRDIARLRDETDAAAGHAAEEGVSLEAKRDARAVLLEVQACGNGGQGRW
jgi:hypothetical protein